MSQRTHSYIEDNAAGDPHNESTVHDNSSGSVDNDSGGVNSDSNPTVTSAPADVKCDEIQEFLESFRPSLVHLGGDFLEAGIRTRRDETLTAGLYNWNIQVLYATHNTNNTLQSTCGFGVLIQYRLWQFGLSSCTRKRLERQESGFYNNMVVVEGFWRNTPQERLSFKSKFRANIIRE
ncbi:hypothetical protein B0H12DRAFT_1072891 [Mycena haematopus]|nr:hypothetical protein B0H12DRAFT_1072891 [Mycena haematopus]